MPTLDWFYNLLTDDKIKWFKGILSALIIGLIVNFGAPFADLINGLGWASVWTSYVLYAYGLVSAFITALVVLFLGKPVTIPVEITEEEIIEEEIIEPIPEPEPEPIVEPEPEPIPEPVPPA